jgi:hypothetical protein
MPPPNITSATATVISSIPYTATQSDIAEAGVTYTVWYKYTSDGTEGVVGEMFRGDGVIYTPSCEVYIDDDVTLLGTISANRMSQLPLLDGRIYYFKVIPNIGNPTPATLIVSLVKQSRLTINRGDIFIRAASILPAFTNAGYTGLGAGIVNPSTGVIKNFEPVFITGEAGDYMPDTGQLLFSDEYNSPLTDYLLYNSGLTLITRITQDWVGVSPLIRTWREGRKFLCMSKGSGLNYIHFFTVTEAGVQSAVTTLTGSVGATASAMNVPGTIVYIGGVGGSANSNIKQWSIAGAAFIADFSAIVATHILRDLLVMSDGKVIALYHDSATDDIFVRVYDSAGTLLLTYTAPVVAYTSTAPRLGYADDASVSFWLFLHQSDGYSRFLQIAVADVSILTNITAPSSDYFTIDQGATPTYRLVTSDSCPLVLLLRIEGGVFTIPPATGDIAIPSLKHDKYYNDTELKIPDPTIRTALIGE